MSSTHRKMRGFEYLGYSVFSCVLIIIFILLPLAPVFANTDEVTNENVSAEPAQAEIASQADIEPEEVSEEQTDVIDVSGELQDEDTEIAEDPLVEIEEDESISSEVNEVSGDTVVEDTILDTASQDVTAETTSPSTETVVSQNPDVTQDEVQSSTTTQTSSATPQSETIHATTTVEDVVLDTANTEATTTIDQVSTTTTEEVTPENPEPVEVPDAILEDATSTDPISEEPEPGLEATTSMRANEQSTFSFSKDKCVIMGEGMFYCAEEKNTATVQNIDRIFAAPDGVSDKEIYMEKDGVLTQITDNIVDDDAPYFDEVSNTIVWHRLIEGRYQIISYDMDDEEETQITTGGFNSTIPNRFGETTVWQGWVGSDWEIFMRIGDEERMLTDNTTHDVSPTVNGTHIIWQSLESDVWHVKVYDIRTGHIETISDGGGNSIQNPRFVLVYDTKLETGDVETKGYDLMSGEVVELGSRPAPLPKEIPDPEQTGEERALVTSQTQLKTKTGTEEDTDDEIPPVDDGDIAPDTLVIPAYADENLIDTASSTESADFDELTLEIPLIEATSTVDIPDLVIPAYTEVASSSDSQ